MRKNVAVKIKISGVKPMSFRQNHKHNAVLPPSDFVYNLTPDVLKPLIRLDEKQLSKYPVYLCFRNKCQKEQTGSFMISSASNFGQCVTTGVVKEIDFGYGVFLYSFYSKLFLLERIS